MQAQHRTRPPNPNTWGILKLNAKQPDDWLVRDWPIQVTNKITSRLADSLLKAKTVRLLRSTLREWTDEDGWQCWRLLGSGGFGTAALWQRMDRKRELLDEIVVKEETSCTFTVDDEGDAKHLATEAMYQSLFNLWGESDNIVHLRGYKSILRDPPIPISDEDREKKLESDLPVSEFWRSYLEYAPYGTLSNLATRYKAFNRYLPELFLWHLFNSLAKATLILETSPDKNVCFYHLDIKPDNIFLGYEGTRSRQPVKTGGLDGETVGYPSIKLGDFGLTHPGYKVGYKGINGLGTIGTPYFQAPELLQITPDIMKLQYGGDWTPPANTVNDDLTPKVNVWGVGKVMYDVFSLSRSSNFDKVKAKNRAEYVQYGLKPVENYDERPFASDRFGRSSPYTKPLSDRIERCMHVEPSRRPSSAELYRLTRDEMEKRYGDPEAKLAFSVRHRKLYYRGNEINDMPIQERNCLQSLAITEYFSLLDPAKNDPDDPRLDIYPEQIWETMTDKALQEQEIYYYAKQEEAERRSLEFRDHILKDGQRIRLRSTSIEILDLDIELTYQGTANDQFFIDGNIGHKGNKGGNGLGGNAQPTNQQGPYHNSHGSSSSFPIKIESVGSLIDADADVEVEVDPDQLWFIDLSPDPDFQPTRYSNDALEDVEAHVPSNNQVREEPASSHKSDNTSLRGKAGYLNQYGKRLRFAASSSPRSRKRPRLS